MGRIALDHGCCEVMSFCYGSVLSPMQCIGVSKLMAVIHTLRFASPPVRLRTDSAIVAEGFLARGREATCACVSMRAHLWKHCWRL
eukprot:7341309-Pyramimonas_sp.AAC.1